jgi:hypothetical protein
MSEPEHVDRNAAIPPFRELYDTILSYRGHSLFYDVLNPSIENTLPAVTGLRRFSTWRPYDHTDVAAQNAMWNLYALSRVNDLLLMSFQKRAAESKLAPVSLGEYEAWFSQLGLTIVASEMFSPFHHEIVQVHQSQEDEEPIAVFGHLWPRLMLGEMLFSRLGVEVIGGRKHVVKEDVGQALA